MPVQTTKSSLFAKHGDRLKQAAEAHKDDPVEEVGFGLPAGIDNGIAQLVECRFKASKKNPQELDFYAAGIAKQPTVHDGIKVEGGRTWVSEPMYDTPDLTRKTFDDHVAHVQAILKRLGCSPDSLGGERIDGTVQALQQMMPHFQFRTWKGDDQVLEQRNGKWYLCNGKGGPAKKGPYATQEAAKKDNPYADKPSRTNHQWGGVVEYAGETSPDVQDDTPPAPAVRPSPNGAKPPSKPPTKTTTKAAEPEPPPEPFNEFEQSDDIDSLLEAAANSDEDVASRAQARMSELAEAAGKKDEADSCASWEEVANLLRDGGEAEPVAEDEPAAEEDWKPAVGQCYYYKPVDPKNAKKRLKSIEVGLLTVNEKTKTVTVKNLDTDKPLTDMKTKKLVNVPWDDLSGEA